MTPTSAATPDQEHNINDLPDIDREKIHINPETGCWEWTARRTEEGYGQAKRHGRIVRAHRHVYETLVGPLQPNVEQLAHLCRVRYCVNPTHLDPVTQQQNVHRGLAAISGELPHDLYRDVLKLVERAYKRGVHDGVRQTLARTQREQS